MAVAFTAVVLSSGCGRESPNLAAPTNAPRVDGQVVATAAGTITKFDVSGAGTVAGTGSDGVAINQAGAITGFYIDNNSVFHGFVRAPDGTITTFDAPHAGTNPGQGTEPFSISPTGEIVGLSFDGNGVPHGFVRAPNGTIATVDDPQAGGQGTLIGNINEGGEIAGYYSDATGSGVIHSFVRGTDGKFTTFDAPGAGNSAGLGTFTNLASCLSPSGAVTGYYIDQNGVIHGYVRAPDGILTEFDAPGAGTTPFSGQGTAGESINPSGAVAVIYADNSGVAHGAVRNPEGAITKFDVPGAVATVPQSNNAAGIVDGVYGDGSGVNHGFVRAPDGTITKFDVPGAGTGAGQGTTGGSINSRGVITGDWVDGAGVLHGYVLTP